MSPPAPVVEQLAARIGRRSGTRGAILCFHGVDLTAEPSASSMHVGLPEFAAFLEAVSSLGRLVPLTELMTRHEAGKSIAGLIAVTADDAYATWLGAERLIVEQGIPLTLFAVSGALERGAVFWWDRIDELALRASTEQWRQLMTESGVPADYIAGHPTQEGASRPLRQWLLAEHHGGLPDRVAAQLSRLEQQLGVATRQRSMTSAELEGFVRRTGVDIGVHTASHAALPFLPDEGVVEEVARGFRELRELVPATTPYLAIPFGLFDARTARLAARAGMKASLTLAGTAIDRPFAPTEGVARLCVVREHSPEKLTFKLSRAADSLGRLLRRDQSGYPALPSATS